MFCKSNIWISSKPSLKWFWRIQWCSSTSKKLNLPNIDGNFSSFKKLKYPESMFVHDYNIAKDISETICTQLIKTYGNKQLELIEVNPGPCLITRHLLENTNYNIIIFENNYNAFVEFFSAIHSVYRNRIHIKHGNLLLLWKLGFQDRMDRGERVSKFLSPIATKQSWNQESPSLKIIAALPNKKFINYLIYSFIFQTGLMTYGRPEFYLLLPPSLFMKCSCKPIVDKKYYKTNTILFQSIFDIKLLKTYPRKAFFPPHSSKSESKNVRFKEIKEADTKYIILAKIVGRQDILEANGLTEDLLKPFWYFVKHHTISRKNFVIPIQWIPGCGPHFIAQGYTIFTQFGDLTPPQILKLFLKFISLPEYKDSPFLSSMESRIAKLLPSVQIASEDSVIEQSEHNSSLDLEEFNDKVN
ncbi:dimethyladenosine transferase 2, mitochondrial isoform X2 [Sipha flava]|uniref:rRNA adenine N(6)-methyltransferase n=1 Tax=Sipha flava TaxID=143950 RepID=A0A8B8F9S3_9HEMI|nr:dimethyladenosine transferase 2, mitochondrial isoform X2 [Sipha flava]